MKKTSESLRIFDMKEDGKKKRKNALKSFLHARCRLFLTSKKVTSIMLSAEKKTKTNVEDIAC